MNLYNKVGANFIKCDDMLNMAQYGLCSVLQLGLLEIFNITLTDPYNSLYSSNVTVRQSFLTIHRRGRPSFPELFSFEINNQDLQYDIVGRKKYIAESLTKGLGLGQHNRLWNFKNYLLWTKGFIPQHFIIQVDFPDYVGRLFYWITCL